MGCGNCAMESQRVFRPEWFHSNENAGAPGGFPENFLVVEHGMAEAGVESKDSGWRHERAHKNRLRVGQRSGRDRAGYKAIPRPVGCLRSSRTHAQDDYGRNLVEDAGALRWSLRFAIPALQKSDRLSAGKLNPGRVPTQRSASSHTSRGFRRRAKMATETQENQDDAGNGAMQTVRKQDGTEA